MNEEEKEELELNRIQEEEDEDLLEVDDIRTNLKDLKIVTDDQDKTSVMERINRGDFLHIAAPMVRFSKLPFRLLCKKWGCDLTFSPMLLAESFNRSEFARDSDFTTNQFDNSLIVQFAANDGEELSAAVEKVANHCQGVDINCGCPQKWIIRENMGAGLLTTPEKIEEMIKTTTRRITNIPLSIKIRIQKDMSQTIELAKRAERAGVSWITVHGRTSSQRSSHPVDYDAIKLVKESIGIPVFANGDIFTLDQANDIRDKTKVNGVMSARGILCNPALYMGYDTTPIECIKEFIDINSQIGGLNTDIFHRHLMYMLYSVNSKAEKKEFNLLSTTPSIIDFIKDKYYL
ncbi:tRNA-dihydrouridine synthase 4-like protein [Cavenderia fasciculata]|uniref:tRNA-dihydrouridine(20a/20b) synthase [NAD(P)+] n=1 Tax=Cavenderia fasciculata TaxID=261658 RepID=F4Q3E3_CACFS|nr:tRNA-dihydrouridine synthase 4-like protein [Cavenderia fasciculata]EGG16812.1 tRNA-dihydrouridine synthase 4-like protein [Cavenderia fasciculata]|eukprot:XP_004355286.1 tRNA-dihydrouridine synthase 4-like protein [Cavenderia fasciculata]